MINAFEMFSISSKQIEIIFKQKINFLFSIKYVDYSCVLTDYLKYYYSSV
jgi:hypothetical protein